MTTLAVQPPRAQAQARPCCSVVRLAPCIRVGRRPLLGRRQQLARAAAESDSGPNPDRGQPLQRLQQEIADLSRLLQAPRINKERVLSKLALVAAQAQVVGAELRAAQRGTEVARRDTEVAALKMKALVVEYMSDKGLLHARGLMEFAERQLFPPSSLKQQSRLGKWQQLGQLYPQLQDCILDANPSWKAQHIPDKAVALYSQLSGRVHAADLPGVTSVLLVEGPLSREDMRFLKCLADAVDCPCELVYKKEPEAIMKGEQRTAGAEGQ